MVTAYTDEYGRQYYIDPDTGKRIGKNEAYSKVGTTIDPETGRRRDIGDTGKRTEFGMFGVKQELASSKYDVGTAASRAMFREEAGIGFDEELKGKQFRKTRRQLARQQRKRERIGKRAQRIERRAIGETNKKQARLKRKAARVRDKYEGPRLEDFDKAADFYDYTRMEDFARESRKQQAENIAAKTIETAGKVILGKGIKEGIQGIKAGKALATTDNTELLADAATDVVTDTAADVVTDTAADVVADNATDVADMSFKQLFGAGKDAFKARDADKFIEVGKQFYDKSKPFIQTAQAIGGLASAGGGEGQTQVTPTVPAEMPMMANIPPAGFTPTASAAPINLQIPQSLDGMSAGMASTQTQGVVGALGVTPQDNYNLVNFVNPSSMQNVYAEKGGRVKTKTNYPKQGGRIKRV
tara:strand:+ start:1653 stop:2894 length:1242 start_codon:yes stop_codon:yes gene_type:complete